MLAISFSGMAIAGCLTFPMSSALGFTGVDGGGPLVFYVPGKNLVYITVTAMSIIQYFSGAMCIIWCMLFLLFIAESPEKQRWISASELEYLTLNTTIKKKQDKKKSTPLGLMLISVPLWSFHIGLCANSFSYFILMFTLPTFIDKTLQLGILMVHRE